MAGPRSIVWLASYPKSGNTWLRAVLTGLTSPPGTPLALDRLIGGSWTTMRGQFDEIVGLASSDMTEAEIDLHRPAFHRMLAADTPSPLFVKVHDAYRRNRRGEPLFPADATACAVYVVRNPLDVAVSFAHHNAMALDEIVARMNDDAYALGAQDGSLHGALPQRLGSWSGHVASWLDQTALDTLVLRYEDMLARPSEVFMRVACRVGLHVDAANLVSAIQAADFHRLQASEQANGFAERQPTAASFFRAGRAGDGKRHLSAAQVRSIVSVHGDVMRRLGYSD